jgi:hypothetical protein
MELRVIHIWRGYRQDKSKKENKERLERIADENREI